MGRWTAALAIAAATWGPAYCGPVHHRREALPIGSLGYANTARCVIVVTRRRIGWNRFCTTVVHEYGHLNNRGHSGNPASVMYPRYVRPFHRC